MDFAPKIKIVFSIIFLMILSGCAEIGAPPGGEVDKTKPRIIFSNPLNGSTQVEPGDKIIIQFSERIVKPISKRPVYISPRPKSDVKLKWKSDKLIITLPDSFAVNQTYIITFAKGVKDLRRNPIDSGAVIAFTTGEFISDGLISGSVFDINNMPQNNVVVGLYKNENLDSQSVIDSLYPTYLTITNNEGYFSFRYIPYGEYQVIAFLDRNNNDRLDTELELYGLTDRAIFLDTTQSKQENLLITITPKKDSVLSIIAVRQNNNNMYQIDFNNDISSLLNHTEFDPKINLHNYVDSSLVYSKEFILKQDSLSGQSIYAYFGILSDGLYQLNLKIDDTLLIFDSISVNEVVDKSNPSIKIFKPTKFKILSDSLDISIQFSEPLDINSISNETFYVIDKDSNLAFPDYEFTNKSLCSIKNNFLFTDVYSYNLYVSEFDIIDLAGNQMGDSTTKFEINLLNADSMGTVKGFIVSDTASYKDFQTILYFKNVATNQLSTYYSDNNLFDMRLVQGSYIVSGFIDLNKNKKRDFGNLSPIKYAEPFASIGDTLKVRARFETVDIRLEFK